MSKVLKWLEEESDRLVEECHSNPDPYKTVNNSFLEGFNYAAANVEALKQPQLNENQQVVFDWAKSYLSEAKNIMWFIEELAFLPTTGGKMRYKQVAYTYESLSDKERRELLSALIAWVQEQEEE